VKVVEQEKTQTPQDAELQLVGKVRARHVVDLPPPTDGTIAAFFAEIGEEVYQGQVLARLQSQGAETARDLAAKGVESATDRVNSIESGIIAARLEASRARAEASRSRGEYDRLQKAAERQEMLYREGATPRITFEKIQGEYDLARSQFEALETTARKAEERVDKLMRDLDSAKALLTERNEDLENLATEAAASEVISPAQGILISRKGEVGQLVSRSMVDFIQIGTQLNELEAVLDAPPPVFAQIKTGQQASVLIAELSSGGLPGVVKGKEGNQVVVEFISPTPAVRPGVSALVRVKIR
jgi:multidrug efflux pump subunit AcrA (membrane-fusion protein)